MMLKLNRVEIAILKRLQTRYPYISDYLPFLKVTRRIFTGVGVYVYFVYNGNAQQQLDKLPDVAVLSTSELIISNDVTDGVVFELMIEGGIITCLELVAVTGEWDGKIHGKFSFEK